MFGVYGSIFQIPGPTVLSFLPLPQKSRFLPFPALKVCFRVSHPRAPLPRITNGFPRFYAASSSDGDTERENPCVRARSEALDPDSTAAATPPSVSLTPSAHPHKPSSVTPAEGVPTADDVPVKRSSGLTEASTPLAATTSSDALAPDSYTTAAVTAAVVTKSDGGHHKGIGIPIDSGSGGSCKGKGASRRGRKGRGEKNMPSAVMNSMADALSHRSLLCFAADFGISGALVSGLEVGDIFLSCGGGKEMGLTTLPSPHWRYSYYNGFPLGPS